MIYEIKEYNQETESDKNPYPDTFTDKEFPLFENIKDLYEYADKNKIYGVSFAYHKDEYLEYKNSNKYDAELPEIVEVIDL